MQLLNSPLFILLFFFGSLLVSSCETDITAGSALPENSLLKDGEGLATLSAECEDCELRLFRITGMTVNAFLNEQLELYYGPITEGFYYTKIYNFNGVVKWFGPENSSGNGLPFHWISSSSYPTIFDQFSVTSSIDVEELQLSFPLAAFHFETRCPISVDENGEVVYSTETVTVRLEEMVPTANGYFLATTAPIDKPCPEVEAENTFDPCLFEDC